MRKISFSSISLLSIIFLNACGGSSKREFQLVFFGDSLMDAPGVAEGERYPQLVAKKLRPYFENWSIVNAGVGGNTTADGLGRIENHLRGEGVIFICLGGNDFLQGRSSSEAKVNLGKLIQIAKSNGYNPILGGLKGPASARAMGWFSGGLLNRNVYEYEKMLIDVAKEHSVPFLADVLEPLPKASWSDLVSQGMYYDPEHMHDTIHPNAKGHRLIADHVYAFVKKEITKYEKMKAGVTNE